MAGLDSQLKDQFQQTVAIALSTSVNNYGERSYSTSTNHLVRLIGKVELVRREDGQEVVSQKQFVCPSTVSMNLTARIWLPGESSSADAGWIPMAHALRVDSTGGDHHQKVWLGRMGSES